MKPRQKKIAADLGDDPEADAPRFSARIVLERRKNFGKWLKARRLNANLTQVELAACLAYDSSQLISNIERGVSLVPSRRLPEYARAIGCSLLEIEIRYFQCSARTTSESRIPELLVKHLRLVELLDRGSATDHEILAAIRS